MILPVGWQALGVIVSNVALIIFYTRMKDMLDYVKSTVVGHLSSDSIMTYNLPIVLWVMIYIAIVLAMVLSLSDLRKKLSIRHSTTRPGGVIMKKKRAFGENGKQQDVVLIKPRIAYDEARDMIVKGDPQVSVLWSAKSVIRIYSAISAA